MSNNSKAYIVKDAELDKLIDDLKALQPWARNNVMDYNYRYSESQKATFLASIKTVEEKYNPLLDNLSSKLAEIKSTLSAIETELTD